MNARTPPPAIGAADACTDVVLRLAGVRKAYGASVAVDGVDLEIRRGEFFTLLGPSGSGKTTTLRLVAGFERPDAGQILLDGLDVAGIPPFERNVNTVFQDYALFPHMSVAENVASGLKAKGVRGADLRERVEDALLTVQMGDFGHRRPSMLSGGQRQRVGLARAIVNRPGLLLLDEPLGALDLRLRRDMQFELKRIQEKVGITFLYVTHDQEEALSMSSRIAVFDRGRVAQVDPPRAVYDRPASAFVAGFVGTSTIIERGGRRLVLRPEKVRLAVVDEAVSLDGLHSERGTIEDAVFVGLHTKFIVRLADGTSIEAVRSNGEEAAHVPLRRGCDVLVAWRPETAWTLSTAA